MNHKELFCLGAVLGLLAVVAGAFGSHALKNKLTQEMLTTFEVGVRYQMYHALAIILVVSISNFFPGSLAIISGWFFFVGTLIFSGSLFLLIVTGVRSLGMITPFGGVLLLMGWFCLFLYPFFGKK